MNKVGPHVIEATQQSIDWVKRAPVVKSLGNPHILQQAPAGAITIFRSYFDTYEQEAADYGFVLGRIFTQLDNFRPTYIELLNEWGQRIGENLPRHIDFVRNCVGPIHQYGSKVAGFSFSMGQPEIEDWLYLEQQGFAEVDAVAIHEYWGKLPFSDWVPLRHRRVHEWLWGRHPSFLITECGRDAVLQDGQEKKPGWKLQDISGEDYAREIVAYDNAIGEDGYVLGAAVFTAGAGTGWPNFDTDSFSHLLPGWGGTVAMPFVWKLAFVDYAKLHPEQVGTPITDLMYDDQGNAWQYSTRGMLFSAKGEGWKVYWHPKAL